MLKRTCCLFAVALVVCGCSPCESGVEWRTDIGPIVKRMPSLSACTNVLWHSKVITKNSLFSIPGPSAYRILCIIPNASRALPVLLTTKLDLAPVADSLEFNDDEIDMLSSVYGVDIQRESKHKSDGLNEALIKSPYWGGCIYFNEKDMLCVVLFGE